MAVNPKSVLDSVRELLQDVVVPEFKALRAQVDSVRTEMQLRDDKLQESINSVRTEMRPRDERTQESLASLSHKLDFAMDIRERLAVLEMRLPKQ